MIIFLIFLCAAAQAQYNKDTPAALYGSAVRVDASTIDDFHEGYAIIRKGEQFAMIDKNGNFFIPYGKYKFNKRWGFEIDNERCGFANGMCAVRDPNSEAYGFIDLTGKLIVPCTLTDVEPFLTDGYAWAKQKDAMGRDEQVFIDKKGMKYRLKDQSLYNHNVLQAYHMRGVNGFTEFYNKKGQLLFKTKRWTRESFSEGLIKVDTTYQLAGNKAGYMDLTGKQVIPYQFKGRLYKFSEGLAQYDAPTSDEYQYMYIDKTGTPIIKLHSTPEFQRIFFDNAPFVNGYAFGSSQNAPILLDRTGKMYFVSQLIEQNNAWFTSKYKSFELINVTDVRRSDHYLSFEAVLRYEVAVQRISGGVGGGNPYTAMDEIVQKKHGMADLTGKIVIPPIYSKVGFPDPVSGLAKVTYTVMSGNQEIEFIGYASKDKIFAILIAPQQ